MAPQDTEAATTAAAAAKADKGKGKASEADASSSMADRKARLSALRSKMAESSRANRKDVLSEQSRTRGLAAARKEASAAHARKLADAEQTLEERDLREAGEDIERHRNFAYSIEDNDRWEDKLQEKERRRDKGVIDFQDAAERAYRRKINALKPDLAAYKAQKASAQSGPPIATGSSDGQLIRRDQANPPVEADVYYGDHKPSDAAVDRVVAHLNHEAEVQKRRSRSRPDDPDEEVTYINKKNKHFNKKIKRYYDTYTKEIRENFERGTAL